MISVRFILIIFSTITLLSSCEDNFFNQTIDIPATNHQTKLAVNSFITNTDSIYIVANVTRTYGLNDYIPLGRRSIDNAVVQLFEGDQLLYTFVRNAGRSGGGYSITIPKKFDGIGKTYTLKVSHPNFEPVQASQTMPQPIPLTTVNYTALKTNNNAFPKGELSIAFNDPVDQENYYEIAIFEQTPYIYFDEAGNVETREYYNEISLLDDNGLPNPLFTQGYNGSALLIDDKTFNGKQKVLNLPFEHYEEGPKFKVYWRSVSKAYFLFSSSLYFNQNIQENPFTEPVSLYSNIDGGIGAFGMRAELKYELN